MGSRLKFISDLVGVALMGGVFGWAIAAGYWFAFFPCLAILVISIGNMATRYSRLRADIPLDGEVRRS
jgi:hypothetical protein